MSSMFAIFPDFHLEFPSPELSLHTGSSRFSHYDPCWCMCSRYIALQNDEFGIGPLASYFKGEVLHGRDTDIFTSNMCKPRCIHPCICLIRRNTDLAEDVCTHLCPFWSYLDIFFPAYSLLWACRKSEFKLVCIYLAFFDVFYVNGFKDPQICQGSRWRNGCAWCHSRVHLSTPALAQWIILRCDICNSPYWPNIAFRTQFP